MKALHAPLATLLATVAILSASVTFAGATLAGGLISTVTSR